MSEENNNTSIKPAEDNLVPLTIKTEILDRKYTEGDFWYKVEIEGKEQWLRKSSLIPAKSERSYNYLVEANTDLRLQLADQEKTIKTLISSNILIALLAAIAATAFLGGYHK